MNAMNPERQEMADYTQAADRAFAGQEPEPDLSGLGTLFLAEFLQAEQDRRPTELRWLQDLRQYKGRYDPEEEAAIGAIRSRSYVRKTRVKVKTVNSRVADLLFPAGTDKNWDIGPTPVPTVPDEMRQTVMRQLQQQAMQQMQQQAQQQPPGSPPMQVPQPTKEAVDTAIQSIVAAAAKGMSKVIDDQLVESRYKQAATQVLHSGHLYGTGILKGPLVERRIRTRFKPQDGSWAACDESYLVPFVESVPLWRWYPDMAGTELSECRFTYERHTFTHAKLYDLTTNKSFRKDEIVEHLKANPSGLLTTRHYDSELQLIGDRQSRQGDAAGQYEVLERWGWIQSETLAGLGITIPPGREQESFFANVWILPNGVVIKAVLQPINGVTWPYHLYYFDKDETSIFGEGLSSIMRDDQKMLNAATRLQIDNAAITSGPMVEVDVSLLTTYDDNVEIAPWTKFLRNGKSPGVPAVRPIVIPSNLEALQAMARQFDTNADEVTAIPRYMNGENATSGAAGTSSGLSMLMGAVNIVIKDLISGYDEGVTTPFLQALYRWNMQFNKDMTIKGDFDVYARGTASLVAKEVRARQLNEFAQMSANPLDAPFVNRHKLNQLRAEALEMSDVIKTEDQVKAEQDNTQIEQQQQMQQQMQAAQLAEQQGKAAKLMADAEVAKARVQQMVASLEQMAADVVKTRAETELTLARMVAEKVAAVFAALQAGGVATTRPTIAPAGDEILKSSGFVDATPNPGLASLNGPPVQNAPGTEALLNRGQNFVPDPRGDPSGMPMPAGISHAGDDRPQLATPTPPMTANPGRPEAQTGQVGLHRGIETDRIEGGGP